jgi:glucokinase
VARNGAGAGRPPSGPRDTADGAPTDDVRPRAAVGLDLGGTTLSGLLVGDDGRALARRRRATPAAEGSKAVLAAMREMATELLAEARPPLVVAGLGLGIPGPIDTDRGLCLFSPNLGWRNLDVASSFRQAFNLPVHLDNDVNVATLGEAWVGAGRDFRTFIGLTLGTGIGSGVILDGRLWRGPGWSAGEIGHIPVVSGSEAAAAPLCGCGHRGCLEAMASGTAIAREARLAIERGEPTALAHLASSKAAGPDRCPRAPTPLDVAEAARAGDEVARRVLDVAAGHLGFAIAAAVGLFNPEAVIIGGGVAGAWDLLAPTVKRVVAERSFPPNLASLKAILPATLGRDAGAIGAASLILAPDRG